MGGGLAPIDANQLTYARTHHDVAWQRCWCSRWRSLRSTVQQRLQQAAVLRPTPSSPPRRATLNGPARAPNNQCTKQTTMPRSTIHDPRPCCAMLCALLCCAMPRHCCLRHPRGLVVSSLTCCTVTIVPLYDLRAACGNQTVTRKERRLQ